jgi:hypothetical protein
MPRKSNEPSSLAYSIGGLGKRLLKTESHKGWGKDYHASTNNLKLGREDFVSRTYVT